MEGRVRSPGNSSVFFASLCVSLRFAAAAFLMALWTLPNLSMLSRKELKQGVGLGIFGGLGLVLQMDAMAYTNASTCAFLTQGYCIWLPLWFSIRQKTIPHKRVLIASLLVVIGTAILAGLDADTMSIGRGELETLLGSILFACQILWLEREEFRGNNVYRFSTMMFASMSLISIPICLFSAQNTRDLWFTYGSITALTQISILVVLCSLISFSLANRWQPEVPATEAGLLYSTEPVFTAFVSLFLPGILSSFSGVQYPNEKITFNLILGGGLILTANILLQKAKSRPVPEV